MRPITEQFTLSDLDANAVSDLTAEYLFDREHGDGSNIEKLHRVVIKNNRLYIDYTVYPTYESETGVTSIGLRGGAASADTYDSVFQFENVLEGIGDVTTWKTMKPAEKIDVVRDFIQTGLCRVHCTCGAFYYQGEWEDMSSHDSSIFKFPGPKGNGVWRARHMRGLKNPTVRICKHLAAAIHRIDRDVTSIVKGIDKIYNSVAPSIPQRKTATSPVKQQPQKKVTPPQQKKPPTPPTPREEEPPTEGQPPEAEFR